MPQPSHPWRSIDSRPGVLVAVVLAAVATAARAEPPASWEVLWDHWYTVEISGATAGFSRQTVSTDGDRYRTDSETTIRMGRGPIEVEIRMSSAFLEHRDGRPIELHFVQNMARQAVDTVWRFEGDRVRSIVRQGERTVEQDLESPTGVWLAPMAAHRYLQERIAAGASTITFRTIDAQAGLTPITMTFERTGEDTIEFDGRTLPTTVWRTTSSMMPGVAATSMVSEDGHVLSDEVEMPALTMVSRISTREAALAAMGGPAPELMVTTFVALERPIPRARRTTRSTLRVRVREGRLPDLPSAGAQRVEADADGTTALLHLDVARRLPAEAEVSADLLASSAMVDASDDMIRALAANACRDVGDDPFARAEAMRRFVHGHISEKSLDTAFATASETARMRTGDCSEHGVLLCAMLRAEGIPARVATGLVYVDRFAGATNVFGWHMWTQALIDGRWLDFDATLERRFDAAHVLTGTSSLADGAAATDLAAIITLMGNMEIVVVEVAYE